MPSAYTIRSIEELETFSGGASPKTSTKQWNLKKPELVHDIEAWRVQLGELSVSTLASFVYEESSLTAHTVALRKECQRLLHQLPDEQLNRAVAHLAMLGKSAQDLDFASTATSLGEVLAGNLVDDDTSRIARFPLPSDEY